MSNQNTSALFDAAKNGNVDEVNQIIEEVGEERAKGRSYFDVVDEYGAHSPQAQKALQDVKNFWVNFINSKSEGGETPLFIAAKNGHAGVVKRLLLELQGWVGGDVEGGEDALFIAMQNRHRVVADLLSGAINSKQSMEARLRLHMETQRVANDEQHAHDLARMAHQRVTEVDSADKQGVSEGLITNPMHVAALDAQQPQRDALGGGRRCRRKTRRRKTRRRKIRRRKTRRRKTHSLRKRKTMQKKRHKK